MTNGNNIPGNLPPIKRCRNYHLYDYKGNRYLDLYLDGGRALMGHKPGKTMLPVKNSLEKGVWAAYPSVYTGRLDKLLGKLFPRYSYRAFFRNRERLEQFLGRDGIARTAEWIPLYKEEGEILVIRPLLPGIDQTHIALSREPLPGGDLISPVLLEGIIRSFHDFTLYREREDFSLWDKFDGLVEWERKGPCLYYRGDREYGKIAEEALALKILIPGDPGQPAFLPSRLSSHEIKILTTLFNSNRGGQS